MIGLLPFVLIGVVWGSTNPFIKRGSEAAARRAAQRHAKRHGPAKASAATQPGALDLLLTPSYVVPQAINLLGSAAFTALLGYTRVTRAGPVTNAVALSSTALCGWCLGDQLNLKLAIFGVALVALGTWLCAN
ncbi:unnamed protein product [Pedinophyceae sp. YPF-701]|nr:unnamed protein product [Pedinophyceae sp. YPF-701]